MSENQIISFLEFVNQDDEDKYNMLVESAAIIRQKETIIKGLDNTIQNLEQQLQQKENIIKEVREYIETKYLSEFDDFEKPFILTDKNDWNKVLEILDKENKNNGNKDN